MAHRLLTYANRADFWESASGFEYGVWWAQIWRTERVPQMRKARRRNDRRRAFDTDLTEAYSAVRRFVRRENLRLAVFL